MQNNLSDKKIAVIGTGYVGFPAALFLARAGATVIGVDINHEYVDAINSGKIPVKEEALQELMDEPGVRARLTARLAPCPADVFIIAVPTPLLEPKKIANLRAVITATQSIVPHLRRGNLVILESTVPPLTCKKVMTPILEKSGLKVGKDIYLAHCPERIFPGNVLYEIVNNARVIGAADPVSRRLASELYGTFVKGELYETDDVTAELCKLAENAYRDVNIAFANEIAAVAEGLGINPHEVIAISNRHPRVNIHEPGIGVGGHCIPIDPWFIREADSNNTSMILAARTVNDRMPERIAGKIREVVKDIINPRIVALGVAYKPNAEDMRESPAVRVVELLKKDGYNVKQYDPLVKGFGYNSLKEVCSGAHCVVMLVKHDVFCDELNYHREELESVMATPIILRFDKENSPAMEITIQ
ncbi:MAG: nucleotide sugar dehydrogenase [bacterium]